MVPLRCALLLFFLLVRVALGFAAGNEPINLLPDPTASTFRTRGMQFWKEELPSFLNEYLPLQNGRVISGGLHPTSGSCTSSAFSLEAITNSSQRITANGAGGTAIINYAAGNIGANCTVGQSDVCWVVGSSAAVPTLPSTNFNRSGTSNLYVDCQSATQPALPANSVYLMKTTITSGAISDVDDLGHPTSPGAGWTEGHAIGVRTDNSKAPILFFVNTFALPLTSPLDGVWHTLNVADFGIPVDAEAIFTAGILIITHGTAAQTCDLTVAFRAKGDTLDPGNYIFQTVETSVTGGQRSTASSWIPVRNGQFELQWNRDDAGAGLEYPGNCSYAINLSAQAYVRYAPVDLVGAAVAAPQPNPDSVYVASLATGGDGTVGNPWTGWNTAINWTQGNQSLYFQAGHYRETIPNQITASRTRIRGAGKGMTVLHYEPLVDSSLGVFDFSSGASCNNESSIEHLTILTADTTHKKVGVNLSDVCSFFMQDVVIGADGGWTGNLSQGLTIKGRERSTIARSEINGDLPIEIKDDPNTTTDLDSWSFRDLTLRGTVADGLYGGNRLPIVAINTGVNLSNVTFHGYQNWMRNAYGMLWQDTTTAVAGSNMHVANVTWTGSTYASGSLLYLEHNTAFRNLSVHNVAVNSTANLGIRLRKFRQVLLDQVYYTGSGVALDVDTTVLPVTLMDFYKGSGTLSVGGLVQASDVGNSDSNHITLRQYDAAAVTSLINQASITSLTTRRTVTSGTAVTNGAFALSGTWGNTASVSGAGGVDAKGTFTVTSAGTGQGASPTVVFTFVDGAWATTPSCFAWRKGGSQLSLVPAHTNGSTTTATFTLPGTPVAAETFIIGYRCTE